MCADCLSVLSVLTGGEQQIQATFTPTAIGKAEALIACCTDSVTPPAGFSAVSHVEGLSVTYTVQPYPAANPQIGPTVPLLISALAAKGDFDSQTTHHTTAANFESCISHQANAQGRQQSQAGLLKADFGDCRIGDSKSLQLVISNDTPIAAPVRLWLDTFQARPADAAAPAMSQPYVMAESGPVLLGLTSGISSQLVLPSLTAGAVTKAGPGVIPNMSLGSTGGSVLAPAGHKHHNRRAGSLHSATSKTKHTSVRQATLTKLHSTCTYFSCIHLLPCWPSPPSLPCHSQSQRLHAELSLH